MISVHCTLLILSTLYYSVISLLLPTALFDTSFLYIQLYNDIILYYKIDLSVHKHLFSINLLSNID